MSGLRMICKMYGGMRVTGANGETVEYVWDYATDQPVNKADLDKMKKEEREKRLADSERAKWAQMQMDLDRYSTVGQGEG